ncbi:RNA 2',3'-cyclic phosphodiesterase [Pseudohalocynthiibacter aestuariivivens]|jgi:RNA 2',3'-cyclic 3'-phosphodiesterase|uniref:RNA 2',3'-cyclic phosphodiesterase n=1 Tax=Pseudohalocynthiibacter aestuariivivens TaxID=1591409 RepID=A0ABV5JJL0_9RHOB|nr:MULTISPECIES: RNA 2',3'-cyclic phosphodiesterase [Pseudohalocynthiibacter]MCK0103823.1 RNA 2',3'-cyclic phosphodiesterase [Pseudohalocynthiibacter sp. F2068]
MRVFLAIDLPEQVVDTLSTIQSFLPVGRPVDALNFHLTLAFLGEQHDELVEEIHHSLQLLSARPFELELAGLDIFGSNEPKILYAGVTKNEALASLHKKIRGALHASGLQLSRERFHPHVTLARFKRGISHKELERLRSYVFEHLNFKLDAFTVSHFSLYRSTLHRDGAIHEKLSRYPLI